METWLFHLLLSSAGMASGAWTPAGPLVAPVPSGRVPGRAPPPVSAPGAYGEPEDPPLLGVLLSVSQGLREREEVGAGRLERAAPLLLAVYLAGLLFALSRTARRTSALLRSALPVRDGGVLRVWDEVAVGSPLRERVRLTVSRDIRRVPA